MRDPVVLGVTVALVRLAGAAVSGMIALVRERARFRALAALARAAGPGTVLVDRPDGGTLVAVGAGGRVLLALLPGAPHPGPGMPVDRAAAPELWAVVDRLADRARAPAPTEPRLVPAANAAVTERVRLLGLVVGGRRLDVGVPLLLGMTVRELEAVLCHELGHYARRHGPFSALAYRGSVALADTCRRVLRVNVHSRVVGLYAGLLGYAIGGYAVLYQRVTLSVRRQQEREADAVAARLVGGPVAAGALRSAHALAAAWDDFAAAYLAPGLRAGTRPDDPFRAFQAALAGPGNRLAGRRRPADTPTSPLDSHPSLAERLALLAGMPAVPAGADPAPALDLLPAPDALFRRVGDTLYGPAEVRTVPWRRWLDRTAARHAAGRTGASTATIAATVDTAAASTRRRLTALTVLGSCAGVVMLVVVAVNYGHAPAPPGGGPTVPYPTAVPLPTLVVPTPALPLPRLSVPALPSVVVPSALIPSILAPAS